MAKLTDDQRAILQSVLDSQDEDEAPEADDEDQADEDEAPEADDEDQADEDEAPEADEDDEDAGEVLVLRGKRADSFLAQFLGTSKPAKKAAKKAAPAAKKAAPAKRAPVKRAPAKKVTPDPEPKKARFF